MRTPEGEPCLFMGVASDSWCVLDVVLYRLSIPFALATGCVAGLLAVQSWEILDDSPFGSPLKLFALVMTITTVYHSGLLAVGSETLVLQSLLIVGYFLILVVLLRVIEEIRNDNWGDAIFRHRNMVFTTVLGLLLFAVVGPLSEIFLPELLHWVHGFAALFAIMGLYSPAHDDFQKNHWNELLLADATDDRQHAEWMMPVDDAILEILYSSGLVLTPAVISYNIDYSREEVNRRLRKLETEGLVERVERGKYRVTESGEQYLKGPFDQH